MSEIKKVELHSVRLDSDIWAWLKAHPQSLNQILRELCDPVSSQGLPRRAQRPVKSPLLKPSEKR